MAVYEDLEHLYEWLDDFPFSRCKKNLTRDFADGVLMAELCKQIFPKIVDLHNYPPANSQSRKVKNWETLNRKVLTKIHIRVTQDMIEQIASGVPGALESVLLAVKRKAEDLQKKSSPSIAQSRGDVGDQDELQGFERDVGIISEIKKLKSEVQMKNEAISILNQKVNHLENLIHMKDKRLKELTTSVERLQTKSIDSQESFKSA